MALELATVKPGDGTNFPKDGDTVRVHYLGKLADGMLFDSSRERGRTFEFKVGVGQVIRGWDEGIKKMSKGQIARLELPPSYGYGEHGYPPIIPPHATLYYEIELLTFCNTT
ncbi:hypothetical protein H257_03913 [Aphanomyces astaci]|uniref:peptidylprolyl isomerase n=2 Tax=Aphanomyces astaci TaxID=112090 RepID=W4H0M8_APHAT|nr:hypothetical protein H257_03913 [Aphanomyces astaci]ETV84829.1 hypothetical protein H257_03913 [Aphanomyces astaci]|eukprot:XP_009826521.1 hypothetical protein H257_03913 [Aphanomyces astaci]